MKVAEYISLINSRYKLGNSTEHTFRGELTQLLESIVPSIQATNEPKRQACGAPDYIITKNDIPVGFIEAKDIGDRDLSGLKKTGNKEQFDRYKASLNNLIFTDYLDFYLYHEGQFVTKIAIGEITDNGIRPLTENFSTFENLIKDFCIHVGETIKSSRQLAEMMAGKARLLSEIIEKALNSDETNKEDSTLKDQMMAFKNVLIHDITPRGFADVYAQTIAYGMFAARLHDPTLPTFSRQEAAELIPKSNPFLRKLFGYIAGPDIDDRIKWIVDSLVEIFLACDVHKLLKNYGKATKMEDPIIHFYETFLSEYDPALRKARGVWYTPAPVVKFIIRAVDDILKTEFGLQAGLADTSKTTVKVKHHVKATADMRSKTKKVEKEEEIHRVQILDPATGTGTFLAEVVKHIHKKFEGQQGIWSNYVNAHLLPRLNGFELLMASYAMAHLKLDLLLTETGYKPEKDQRLKVYLTNSLEEHHPDTGTLFANWLSSEANEANRIKRDTPVMCVIGNPPYSGESANKGKWIMDLMADYKKEPGGIEKLKERNPKWINDDYVKFLRYGQHYIEKNGSGILAFINPHGFLDNPTFRGMRWNLLKTYDKIYTIDLHGNSNKKEISLDGTADENVFDIQQGVSINFFVKTGKKEKSTLGKVFHYELFGKRNDKYFTLNESSLKSIPFTELTCEAPMYYMIKRENANLSVYERGFKVNELFALNNVGMVTARDDFSIGFNPTEVKNTIVEFLSLTDEAARSKFNLGKDVRDWQVGYARQDLISNYPYKGQMSKVSYRPFDDRWTFYTGKSKGFHCYPRYDVMQHFVGKSNMGLSFTRRIEGSRDFADIFVFKEIIQHHSLSIKEVNIIAPLYTYSAKNSQLSLTQSAERTPNVNPEIVAKIAEGMGVQFVSEKETEGNVCFVNDPDLRRELRQTFAPIDLLDYIYAVLHSPAYREKYMEFLKTDFPRIPYPNNAEKFWQLVKIGGEIRRIHLLESPIVEQFITKYPMDGDNVVVKPEYKDGNVYINEIQYFANVSLAAWEFYIGGYQPAQKWLKDRKGRTLEFDDILHYQKIIVALTETARITGEIDFIIQF